jgi:hypothetical protein
MVDAARAKETKKALEAMKVARARRGSKWKKISTCPI